MTAAKEFAKLKALSERPPTDETAWLAAAAEAPNYLVDNSRSEDVLIYASMPHVFVHGVLAPAANVTPPDIDDLLRSYFDPGNSWVIQRSYGGGEGHRMYLEPPMASPGCKSLAGSEKLIFRRSFDGMKGYDTPTEISQKIVHALGLHFMETRGAYCRLNDEGDIEDVITIITQKADDPWESSRAVFIKSRDLAKFMALSETVLFRKFDFTRTKPGGFNGWSDQGRKTHRAPDLAFSSGVGGQASFANGYQICRTSLTVDDLVEAWKSSDDKSTRQYETFKIFDGKNRKQVECSANPDSTSNYFTKSDKPFDISPAFFRPEVLHRYKADPEKYELEHRSISCRNSWSLKTYDINDEGQVHTYICYLADLPYSEQQYWKLYNEWPKGPISARAYQTDIEGNFSTEPDPLVELEYAVDELDRLKPSWWSIRSADARPKVLYPATTSPKEWADEILALDQLLVESFYSKGLKALAAKAGATLEPGWASLKIVEACLAGNGMAEDEAKETVEPLRELHHLRSKVKGHATAERRSLEDAALKEHGSLRAHFFNLAQRCADSFKMIAPALQSVK